LDFLGRHIHALQGSFMDPASKECTPQPLSLRALLLGLHPADFALSVAHLGIGSNCVFVKIVQGIMLLAADAAQ
jgi:hypothetical protein